MNPKQGQMGIKVYALRFTQLLCYAPEFISSMRSLMRKFVFSLSEDLVVEFIGVMSNREMDMPRLVVYIR